MAVILRTLSSAAVATRRPRLSVQESSVLRLRVLPSELDVNVHMNNGCYFQVMDLGRTDLVIRLGMGKVALKNRWQPLLGSTTIRFRRPLGPFKRYELHTQIVCWDDKWFFLSQTFFQDKQLAASAIAKVLWKAGNRTVPPAEALAAIGHTSPSPSKPDYLTAWTDSEAAMVDAARGEPARISG